MASQKLTTHQSSYSYSTSKGGSGDTALTSGGYSYSGGKKDSKVVVKNTDMEEELSKDAIRVTEAAFEKFTVEKDIAAHIKKEFDREHGSAWHCIVGRNYGSYVTHETNHFIYLYVKQVAILLFKSG